MALRRARTRRALSAAAALGCALAAARPAGAVFACPEANMGAHVSCYCTSGCSVNADTAFPWRAPVFPPASTDLGSDTICASVTLPCLSADPAYVAMLARLGMNGTVSPTLCVPRTAPLTCREHTLSARRRAGRPSWAAPPARW